MFCVYIKDDPIKDLKKLQHVYAVKDDKAGYPHFLIRYKNQWKWISAKHCIPLIEVPMEIPMVDELPREVPC